MKILLVFVIITLGCTLDVKSQIINDEATIMTIPGDHVLINKPRVLIYPSFGNLSSEIASLNDKLIGKKINIQARIYEDKVEYLELKMSSRIPPDVVISTNKLLKNKVKYFLLDKPNLKGAEYYDFSYVLRIMDNSSK